MKKLIFKLPFTLLFAALISLCAFFSGCLSSEEWFEKTIKENYFYEVPEEAFDGGDFKETVKKYLDIYSAYYTANEYESVKQSNAGSKSGIGISYSYVEGKGVYVASVTGNSPAYISGLRVGDWLESATCKGEKTVFKSASDLSGVVSGAKDGESIEFASADGKTFTLSKAEYTATYTYMCTDSASYAFSYRDSGLKLIESERDKIEYLPEGCAYINLSQFYGSAGTEFMMLAEEFNALNLESMIIDLRSNGGGYVSVMQEIAGCFAEGEAKTAMVARDKYGREDRFSSARIESAKRRVPKGTKIYVMANNGTASASEALIGALVSYGYLEYKDVFLSEFTEGYVDWLTANGVQDIKNARTYGKGIMQSTFTNYTTGEALKLTTAQIYWPNGKCIHDKGLTPEDGCTKVKADWERLKPDTELQNVIKIIESR